MRKILLLTAALVMVMMFSGSALAKSTDNHPENINKAQQITSAKDKAHEQAQTQTAKKNHVQDRVKKSVGKAYHTYSAAKTAPEVQCFSDVNEHWAAPSIRTMTAIGIFKGYPDGTFKPDRKLSQAEALVLVINISEEDNSDEETPPGDDQTQVETDQDSDLSDIPAWAHDAADKALKKGVIKLNRFHSGVQASRAQTAVMIAKALGLEPVDTSKMPFKDGLLISKEDVGYIMALYREGIMTGSPNGNFNPNSAITRAEMASLLERLLQKSEIESVTLPATATLMQGKSLTLEATVKYADGSTSHEVSWSSSDTTLATVDNGVVTAAADKTGTVTISATATRGEATKSASCIVTIKEDIPAAAAQLNATNNTGIHDGKIYEEYALKADSLPVSLAQGQVKSITLQKDNGDLTELDPNTDANLWFNVQRESGRYTLKVTDLNDKVYEAVLDWTAPSAINAATTGNNIKIDGDSYLEYQLGDLNLSDCTCIYQIGPDGQATKLDAQDDANLWFKTSDQPAGQYTLLLKQDGFWYSSSIAL